MFRFISDYSLLGLMALGLIGSFSTAVLAEEEKPNQALAPQNVIEAPGNQSTFQKVVGNLLLDRLEKNKVPENSRARTVQASLLEFYSQRNGVIWTDIGGLTAKAKKAIFAFKKADKFGLKASDYRAPIIGAALSRFNLDAHVDLELRMSKLALAYLIDARGGKLDPSSLTIFLDVKPRLGNLSQDLIALQSAKANKVVGILQKAHPRHPHFAGLVKHLEKLRTAGAKEKDIIRVLLNMQRWRYLPYKLSNGKGIYVQNNIPELRSRVFKNEKKVFEEIMIAGKVSKKTPVFSDKIEWIEIHPTWYIPNSIKVNDIYPRIKRGSKRILERFDLHLNCGRHGSDPAKIDWDKVNIRNCSVIQPPSRQNVLGYFKFKFPNKHSVYMHDTDERHLFKRSRRLLSHGCMRVKRPQKMASILLGHDKGMSDARLTRIVKGPRRLHKEVFKEPVPIHTTYFTLVPGADGKVKKFPDYYGHDRRMAKAMYGKGSLFPAAKWEPRRKYKPKARKPRVKKDWRSSVLD